MTNPIKKQPGKNSKNNSRPAAFHKDRRKHPRFPILSDLVEPINLVYTPKREGQLDAGEPNSQPAILTNLSAGGLSLTIFAPPPHTKHLKLDLNLHGLPNFTIEGEILWANSKGGIYTLGIGFINIKKKDRNQLNCMAQDHLDCETRISLNLPEVCVASCKFHGLCNKLQKIPYWKT